MTRLTLVLLTLIISSYGRCQTANVSGKIESKGEPIAFAQVIVKGTQISDRTDTSGYFRLSNVPYGDQTIMVATVGYHKLERQLSIDQKDVELTIEIKSNNQLEEVVVSGTMNAMTRAESPVPVEVYTKAFLKSNPTPSVYEAMDNVNGVRPQLNCSVCNTGDIHINGMEGPYTMITVDGMPIVGGLSTVYGLHGIPNSLIERIEVVKGPASTLYGSEAVGGLINIITKDPASAPAVDIDVRSSTWLEHNFDLGLARKVGDKASTLISANYYNYSNPIDNNGDNFTDITLQDRFSVFNKWNFKRKKGRVATIAGRFIYEDRWGGEMQWTPEFRGGDSIYGESIYTIRGELIGSYDLPTTENIQLQFSGSVHNQNSVYGDMVYIADQRIGFTQLVWRKEINDNQFLTVGTPVRYTYYDDNTPATSTEDTVNAQNRPNETILPGLFIQDEIRFNRKNTLLIGGRWDYHPEHGNIFSPRINYKWAPTDNVSFRLSGGNGFRVVSLFTEDHAALTGSRQVVIAEELSPEVSYNANFNYLHYLYPDFGTVTLDASAWYTFFTNKIIPDYDTDDDKIIYENLDGSAVSQGVSASITANTLGGLRTRLGVTLMDVFEREEINGSTVKIRQMLTESYSATWAIGYEILKWRTTIDYTGNLYGPMRLPILENDPRPEYSDPYSIQNIQITKSFSKGWEVYGGVKNLLNFTPPANSIMRAHDPFDELVDDPVDNPNGFTFDPAYVYAPNQGIRGFLGVRWTVQ